MNRRVLEIYRKLQFSSSVWSIFFNPMYISRKSLYNKILQLSNKLNGKLLDFGCGSKPYIDLFKNVKEYIGVDIEVSGHDFHDKKADFFYDGKKLPFNDEEFDSIFSSEVLEHVFNIDEILSELNRVLKKKGLMLITIPFVWDEHEQPYDFARYTTFGIKYLLEKHGFRIVEIKKSSTYIEAITQMLIMYMYKNFLTKYKSFNIFIRLFLMVPLTLLGLIFSKILPNKGNDFYLNNIILVEKIK